MVCSSLMTDRRFCVRRSEITKGPANKKATVFAEDALAFSKCQLEKCHFMCTMGYYCTNSCTIMRWAQKGKLPSPHSHYFRANTNNRHTNIRRCGSKVMALWKCRLKKKRVYVTSLGIVKVIFTMSVLCGLETSSLYNGEAHTSFYHLKYSLYSYVVLMLGNMKRLYRIYISFSDTEIFVIHMPL